MRHHHCQPGIPTVTIVALANASRASRHAAEQGRAGHRTRPAGTAPGRTLVMLIAVLAIVVMLGVL